MAKKQKAPLTPEQVAVKAIKKTRRGDNAARFFAVLLALLLTVGTVFGAQKFATKDAEPADSTTTEEPDDDGNDPFADEPGDSTQTPGDNTQTPGDNNNTQTPGDNNNTQTPGDNNNTQKPAAFTKADAAKLLNDVTKTAADAKSYKIDRVGKFTKPVVLGNSTMTTLANNLIKGFDPNGSIDSVVGSFIGIGEFAGTHTKGDTGDNSFKDADGNGKWNSEKWVLKAMTLSEADIANCKQQANGDYLIQIVDCDTPNKDGKNALHHATNDFTATAEIESSLKEYVSVAKVGSDTKLTYSKILYTVSVKDGKLAKLDLSYNLSASLALSVGFSVNGTGKASVTAKYSDFVY